MLSIVSNHWHIIELDAKHLEHLDDLGLGGVYTLKNVAGTNLWVKGNISTPEDARTIWFDHTTRSWFVGFQDGIWDIWSQYDLHDPKCPTTSGDYYYRSSEDSMTRNLTIKEWSTGNPYYFLFSYWR